MKKILILLIVALLAAGGYYWYTNIYNPPEDRTEGTPAPGSEEEEVPETTVGETATVTVIADEYSFSPATITAKAGGTVRLTFRNNGNVSHDFVITELNVNSQLVAPGESQTFEFDVPTAGTYTFYCSIPGHEESGMVGTLTVE